MNFVLQPWQLLLLILAGWINRKQQNVIDYLKTENEVLRYNYWQHSQRTRNGTSAEKKWPDDVAGVSEKPFRNLFLTIMPSEIIKD